jgi:hypothetical protein
MTMQHCRTACTRVAFILTAIVLPGSIFAQVPVDVIPANAGAPLAISGNASVAQPSFTNRVPLAGPRVGSAILVAAREATPAAPSLPPGDGGARVGRNLALVGVGAAAVVAGLLVGGDGGHAVAIGGTVVGLVGLYRYLR